jgi:hypothetical protein
MNIHHFVLSLSSETYIKKEVSKRERTNRAVINWGQQIQVWWGKCKYIICVSGQH